MINTTQSSSLSISHARPSAPPLTGTLPPTTSSIAFEPLPSTSRNDKQRSVGTQAKIGAPVKIISPRPWKEIETPMAPSTSSMVSSEMMHGTMSSGVSAASSRPPSNRSIHEIQEEDRPKSTKSSSSIRSINDRPIFSPVDEILSNAESVQ